MKRISSPRRIEDQNEINVTMNEDECDALNEAVNWYVQNHQDDPSDNIIQRLKVLKGVLHEFFTILSPS
jgi:hypothetical protein